MLALSPTRSRRSAETADSSGFEQMIPQIRRHVRSAINGKEPHSREQLVAGAIANAFEIFSRLAEDGLSDLAYPRPLAMVSLVRLRQTKP